MSKFNIVELKRQNFWWIFNLQIVEGGFHYREHKKGFYVIATFYVLVELKEVIF